VRIALHESRELQDGCSGFDLPPGIATDVFASLQPLPAAPPCARLRPRRPRRGAGMPRAVPA